MKKLLLRPCEIFSGKVSLLLGISVMALTALICTFGKIHLDGILDLHIGQETNILTAFGEGVIDLLSIVVFIYIAGFIFIGTTISIINIMGRQALARFPILLSSITVLLLNDNKVPQYQLWKYLHQGQPTEITTTDIVAFIFLTLISLALIIWSIILMYRAYFKSCAVKGTKAVLSFIAIVILSEITSKLLIINLFAN